MISEYTLKMLCDKYNLNVKKLVNKNNNILEYGKYHEIDQTLNYLINELLISPSNIEKCPSILYRNVGNIKQNVEFLKRQNIIFENVETCLHILVTEPNELIETYNYVKLNYGENVINRITSILYVSKSIIIDVEKLNIPFKNKAGNLSVAVGIKWGSTNLEEIEKIIHSAEFKNHPELFTSETLASANLEDIQKIINSIEFREHPELFTSETLARAKLEDIKKIIHSSEFRDYPELFTSTTLAHANLEEIKRIINSSEFREHPELFTSETLIRVNLDYIIKIIHSEEFKNYPELFTSQTLAHAKFEEIQKIIHSEEFKEYPELFTSTTLAFAKFEEIQQLLKMEYWKDERFKKLLTSTVVARSKSMIFKLPIIIQIAEDYNIDTYLNTSFLLNSPSHNYALIQYLIENNIPLIINGKLNSVFCYQPGLLKKKFNIDIKKLIIKYPLKIEKFKARKRRK